MKNITYLFTCLIAVLLFVACSGDDATRDAARQSLPQRDAVADPIPPAPAVPTTATNTGAPGQMHYTCPNNCAGSGGDTGGTCPVCGTAYVHNQAYHGTSQANPTSPTPITTTTTPTADPSPAQNAAGVWHYTCSASCGGGGGAAGSCPSCGAALAHNQAYHN